MGEVTHSQKKGAIGKPAVIGVMVRSVEAVDGTVVPISGVKYIEGENKLTEALVITILCCILGLVIQGGEAEIPAGANMQATIDATTTIELPVDEEAPTSSDTSGQTEIPTGDEIPAESGSPSTENR